MYSVCTKVYQDVTVYKIIGGAYNFMNEIWHTDVSLIYIDTFFLLMSRNGQYGATLKLYKYYKYSVYIHKNQRMIFESIL